VLEPHTRSLFPWNANDFVCHGRSPDVCMPTMWLMFCVSREPLVLGFFSLSCTAHRRRLACLCCRPSSRLAGARRHVPERVIALFIVAIKSTRDHPISIRSSHHVGVDECPAVEPLAGAVHRSARLRPAVAPPNPFVPVLAVCCRSAFMPWCPLCKGTHRRRSRTSPPASFAALPFLWGKSIEHLVRTPFP
jgi:hypothetical protein